MSSERRWFERTLILFHMFSNHMAYGTARRNVLVCWHRQVRKPRFFSLWRGGLDYATLFGTVITQNYFVETESH